METFSLRLGAVVPNFQYTSTDGQGSFHEYLTGNPKCPWTIVFSHPKDYTPVCTTELAQCHKLAPEFEAMGIKLCGISCDSAEDHHGWTKDVLAFGGTPDCPKLAFPIIADEKRDIVTQLGMLDPLEKDNAGIPLPARALYIIGANKEVKLALLYPATTGRNFDEIKRICTSLKMTVDLKLATPANWKYGDRAIVAPGLSTEDAKKNFENLKVEDLPSGKGYLRTVDCPKNVSGAN